MIVHEIKKRVRYGETDKMGYLYYGIYASYYEIGRTEMMRAIGFPYRDLEDKYDVMLPVKSMNMRFVRPALYDDLVTIRSTMKKMTESVVVFYTELFNEKGKIMNAGEVRLSFVNASTMKGCKAPTALLEKVQEWEGKVIES